MSDPSALAHVAAAGAAAAAGLVNSIAGGGTLISFPALTAVGVPALHANATNTVALMPGYLGGVQAQRNDLDRMTREFKWLLLAAALGGLAGSVLLVVSSDSTFKALVPFLILSSVLLMAFQDRVRSKIFASGQPHQEHAAARLVSVGLVAVYGGYFGAGLGIMLIAVLGLFSQRKLNELNAVKLVLASVINAAAAAFLATSDKVEWTLVAVMAPAALIGGHLGGRLASRLPAKPLRGFVIVIGSAVALVYLVRLFR
jgi:uncharacterized membrane protein YfcA